MQAVTVNYKLIKKIKDERFDDEQLHEQSLIIQTGPKDFQVAVIDSNNRLMLLEDYAMGNVQSHNELLAALKDLFDSHALLKAGFWKEVKIGIKNNKFCQVPTPLFDESLSKDYLKLNASVDFSKERVLHCGNQKNDAITVFAIQEDLHQWLSDVYQNTTHKFYHQSCALVEGVLSVGKSGKNILFVYVDRFKLHVLSSVGGRLLYYNQFPINQFPDYIKYIMLVLKGLNMNQQNSEIVLWGYIGKSSPHYQEFIKYIRNVTFGGRPSFIKFGYMFDEVQDHHFFDLFSLHLLK
ncbi:hypothetical protein WSM22_44490 [Cytophagales bacterium WSM2-2]|nr:hypothetical protein WSM22_44490 [Cytophagales bacterium WSM2-2]